MATATKKTSKKKVSKRKTGGERNSTPPLTSCPFDANMTRPHTTESSGKLATKAVEFIAAKEAWVADVRKAFAGGAKASALPEFSTGKFANPNVGILSRKAYEALVDEFNESGDGIFPPRYNPVLVDLVHAMQCRSLRRGSVTKHPKPPKDWDEKEYGNWWHEWSDDGEDVKEPSGWHFDSKMPRRCHADKAEMLIVEPEKNLLTFGNLRIVCGTGTHPGSAVFMVNQTSHGNYRAGDITRKRMSLAGIKEIPNIVFKIEDRPNNGGGFTVKGEWSEVREMVYLPGQVFTAGYLYDSKGKPLDAKAIRGLDADTKGLRFKALEAPIVGKAIPWVRLWKEIQVEGKVTLKAMKARGGRSAEFEAGSTETKSITNLLVNGRRVDPSEAFPFGLRGSQINMPAYIVASGEGKVEEGCFSIGVVVGARANAPYNVGVHAAKGEGEEAETETPAKAKPKAKKAAAKATKPKATKKAAKAKPTDAAPPVESNTADEDEVAENETVEAETVVAE